jgi:YHS domain-containing protein
MMRQIGKQILTIVAAGLLAIAPVRAESLVTTIVTDPLTGVAIEGYDPVSFFIADQPILGLPDYEYEWGGVPWYFASAANRDVFIRNPGIYMPQFGGHCVMSLSRGFLSDGKAKLYAIEGLKLYFFYSSANRDAFLLNKSATIQAAEENWPKLEPELSDAKTDDGTSVPASDSSGDASATSSPADAPSVAPSSAADNVSDN